jgi:hypothetical protein
MSSDDFGHFPPTDDWGTDWWTWIERLIRTISDASIRLGAAVLSAGFAIAASNMVQRQDGLATLTLGAAGVFAAWFVVSSFMSIAQRR